VYKKIALISEHASPLGSLGGVDSGGQNVYVAQVARRLASQGCQVDVFTRRDSQLLPESVRWMNVNVINVPAGPARFVPEEEMLPLMEPFRDYLAAYSSVHGGYDLIHANFWMSGLVAAEIKRLLSIPFVITFHALGRVRRLHQGQADRFPDERFAIEDRIVEEADAIIAECPQDEEDLLKLYRADPAKVTVVGCGFDTCELWPLDKPLARVALGFNPSEKIVLQLGRMVPRKGVDNAIRGFARLVHTHGVAARLVIVGGESEVPDPLITPEIGRLRAIAAEEEVAHRVLFIGRRGRELLRYFYSAADVFVTTPIYEPFGITPLEAMACATPVVGSRVGGIQYTVRDGETGYLVPAQDPEALAERLAQLYGRPGLREEFGQNAAERVHSLFTWEKVGEALDEVYRNVAAGAPLPEPADGQSRRAVWAAGDEPEVAPAAALDEREVLGAVESEIDQAT
jgi:D-inositol-3-phosphate glycosyltransferase